VIYKFNVEPLTIGLGDSIRTNWQVRGEATLLIHDRRIPDADTNVRLRELTLVVQKNGKEVSQKVQVTVLPNGATDRIVFRTALHGDTLVAAGYNNALRWGDAFVIRTTKNTSGRQLEIRHAGKVLHCDDGNPPDTTFSSTPVKGEWEFRSLLSPAEKSNHQLAPERLAIQITVQHH